MQTHAQFSNERPLVIVVDGDHAVRNSLKFSLEIEGFAVNTYPDCTELLKACDLATCGCLVIDQYLPGLTGLEAIARLRERRIFVPAILITSYPSTALAERARKANVPIVEKPFLGNVLLERIQAAFSERTRP